MFRSRSVPCLASAVFSGTFTDAGDQQCICDLHRTAREISRGWLKISKAGTCSLVGAYLPSCLGHSFHHDRETSGGIPIAWAGKSASYLFGWCKLVMPGSTFAYLSWDKWVVDKERGMVPYSLVKKLMSGHNSNVQPVPCALELRRETPLLFLLY